MSRVMTPRNPPPLVIYEYQLALLRPILERMVEGRDYVIAPKRIPTETKDAE